MTTRRVVVYNLNLADRVEKVMKREDPKARWEINYYLINIGDDRHELYEYEYECSLAHTQSLSTLEEPVLVPWPAHPNTYCICFNTGDEDPDCGEVTKEPVLAWVVIEDKMHFRGTHENMWVDQEDETILWPDGRVSRGQKFWETYNVWLAEQKEKENETT